MNKEERAHKRALFLNRQPTLFRHGCPGVTVEPVDDDSDNTIHLSPFILEGMNAD
ncbi:MAG: hypothetical protein K9H48_07840 [Melioribacteraceae bacterium]|nr:hypothetical protein [Melioribacteraceae bacterium]